MTNLKKFTLTACLMLSFAAADKSYAADKEVAKDSKKADAQFCFDKKQNFSLGAVVQKEGVHLRCSAVHVKNAEAPATLAWVPLNDNLKALP